MVPTQDNSSRGRSSVRASDAVGDEGWNMDSDSESMSSRSSDSCDDFFPARHRQEYAPVFRLKKGEQDKPVYEAWNIHYFPGRQETVEGYKVLGINIESYDDIRPHVDMKPQPSVQSELAEKHLRAIEDYRAKHKRSWPVRAFAGKGKTYEQDLEERCDKLPKHIKAAITRLLLARERGTSTQYRTRAWTVVSMREQVRHRFTDTDFPEVKCHKLRRWKNTPPEMHRLFTVVIRGAETKVVADGEIITTSAALSNPWTRFDNAEARQKTRERLRRWDLPRRKRRTSTPGCGTTRGHIAVSDPELPVRIATSLPAFPSKPFPGPHFPQPEPQPATQPAHSNEAAIHPPRQPPLRGRLPGTPSPAQTTAFSRSSTPLRPSVQPLPHNPPPPLPISPALQQQQLLRPFHGLPSPPPRLHLPIPLPNAPSLRPIPYTTPPTLRPHPPSSTPSHPHHPHHL
ncbi:hypothetical protein N0V88_007415 [Collariella sp. IMI 366227]|nr:hypothetical protein N0V88_007415 [Collariella sp. IMI 366227]